MTGEADKAAGHRERSKARYRKLKAMTPEERAEHEAAAQQRREVAARRRADATRTRDLRDRAAAAINSAAAYRLAEAKARLAARHAASAVPGFSARMARLDGVSKRERQRVEHLVLGYDRPTEVIEVGTVRKRRGGRKTIKKTVPVRLEPGIEEAVAMRERWSAKHHGTPQTWDAAARQHQGALVQLHRNGTIDSEQLEWTAQIANVHRSIESDVGVVVASLEARVDSSSRGPAIAERIHRVRMHRAYSFWRDMLPAPKSLVLDMIVGDAVGYTVAARRYRVHNRKAKRFLLEAIQRWPLCVALAFSEVDQATVDAMNMARPPVAIQRAPAASQPTRYEAERAREAGRERTDEAYLLPPLDPIFVDDRGYLLPWADIARIIRDRAFGETAGETAPLDA